MNKVEFLNTLEKSLGNFTVEERTEILYDYEEHFAIGEENGKTEEELIQELGDPKNIAKQYKATQRIERAQADPTIQNIFSAVFAGVSLGFFNLVFILGPFVGLIGVVIGLFGASIGVIVGGVALMIGSIILPFYPQFNSVFITALPVAAIFFGIGLLAVGLLFFIGNCYISKCFYKVTVKYLKWNLNFIKKQGV